MSQLNFERVNKGARLPFGKHADEFITEVPTHYLEWAEENLIFPAYAYQIAEELKARRDNRPGAGKVVKRGNK